MSNVFTNEFDEDAKKDQSSPPFRRAHASRKTSDRPLASRERAAKFRNDSAARKSKDQSRQVSLHAWLLYIIRFIFDGDLTASCGSFGGLSAQFSHLSVALHLAVAGTSAFALANDHELRVKIQRMARKRDSPVCFTKLLSGENEEIKTIP